MFDKIDIGIKTFLRDPQLFTAIEGIRKNFPGARMVIVDDGDQTEEKDGIYSDLHRAGHITDILPFDSGFGRKSNRIVELSTRPYLLIASDDFEFDKDAAKGLRELEFILEAIPNVSIASGRVNKRKYEFNLEISDFLFQSGTSVREVPLEYNRLLWIAYCDLTVNYSLIRKEVFEKVRWDDEVKIGGGEHGAFFYDCKLAGFKTVCAHHVNINEQKVRNSARYKEFRNRANSSERPCFDKRNIVEYILGDGRIDYRRAV